MCNRDIATITLDPKPCLMLVEWTINIKLCFVHPFNSNQLSVLRSINKLPCFISFNHKQLLLHCSNLILIQFGFFKICRLTYNNVASLINIKKWSCAFNMSVVFQVTLTVFIILTFYVWSKKVDFRLNWGWFTFLCIIPVPFLIFYEMDIPAYNNFSSLLLENFISTCNKTIANEMPGSALLSSLSLLIWNKSET